MNIIVALKYLILGIVQGIAEILPISSSGHLALLQYLFDVNPDNEAVFAIFLHFASLLALLIFFRKLIYEIVKGFILYIFKREPEHAENFKLGLFIIIASIPAAIVGFLLESEITSLFGDLLYVGIGFLITATLLFLWPVFGKKTTDRLTIKHAMVAGVFQAMGILPGISRSGITITGAKVSGLDEQSAKRFAFLLFIPIALGSFVLSLTDVEQVLTASPNTLIYYVIALVASFIFTYAALMFIFKKFRYSQAKYFGIYLLAIGITTIIISLL